MHLQNKYLQKLHINPIITVSSYPHKKSLISFIYVVQFYPISFLINKDNWIKFYVSLLPIYFSCICETKFYGSPLWLINTTEKKW